MHSLRRSSDTDPAAAGSAGRRHTLIAGDVADLREIRSAIAALPHDARGQVFIEVFAPIQITRVDAPGGMVVSWLCRDVRVSGSRRGAVAARGEAIVRAVDAWLDEWMRASTDPREDYVVWFGCRTSSIANAYYRRLEREFAEREPQEAQR